MKTTLLLICSICFYNLGIAQDYTPMFEIGKIWHMKATDDINMISYFNITVTEIVEINGVDYFHLETPRFNCETYLRDDLNEKKVYGFLDGEEFLLFDFTLEIGDYININGFNHPIISVGSGNFFGMENLRYYKLHQFLNLIEGIGLSTNGIADGFELNCIFFPNFERLEVVDISQSLAINDLTIDQLSYYPNPVIDNLHFDSKSAFEIKDLKVYSILGKPVLSPKYEKEKKLIDVSSLHNGIYFLKIETDAGYLTKKIIKTTH